MSRKDFVLIADALVEANASLETVNIMANALDQNNPRFDKDRFTLAAMNWE